MAQHSNKEVYSGTSEASSAAIEPESNQATPAMEIAGEGLIGDIIRKSQKIVRQHFELSTRLADNEKSLEELSEDLEVLRGNIDRHEKEKEKLAFLEKHIREFADRNAQLAKDVEILTDDLASRENLVNLLKRSLWKKFPSREKMEQRDQQISSMQKSIASLEHDIGVLRKDLVKKDSYLAALKRIAASRQAMFLGKELREKEDRIFELGQEAERMRSKLSTAATKISQLAEIAGRGKIISKSSGQGASQQADSEEMHQKLDEVRRQDQKDKAIKMLIKMSASKIAKQQARMEQLEQEHEGMETSVEEMRERLGQASSSAQKLVKITSLMKHELSEKDRQIIHLENGLSKKEEQLEKLAVSNTRLREGLKVSAEADRKLVSENKELQKRIEWLQKDLDLLTKKQEAELSNLRQTMEEQYGAVLERMKGHIIKMLRKGAESGSKNKELKARLEEALASLEGLKLKEEFYKDMLLKLTRKEIELKSELELSRKRQ